ncbi:hypothetical protein [Mucilaginibacter paludis]|uniref:Thiamine pyrophosphokinase n=1 Tax=Mucilaginibacter paludis DSM 18603 TaxID=714943 RepID=H1YDA0_9SPHI|nr:hypothetical protein [Mucilaginibacter paludis]EHQ27126.1 thiamine pyrophosphokinase [Mucilaginibacter paludis DSM 18603]
MSSHHIIREKQEPALLVLGLNNFPDELLGQLLEWSPTLIVTIDTSESMNAFGIKYDALVGEGTVSTTDQSDIKYIAAGSDHPAQAALNYLVANNYPAVNVITDDLVLEDYLSYASHINIVLFHRDEKIYPVTSGFSKWKPAGETIRIMSEADGLQFTGLENVGNQLYRTLVNGLFSLQFNNPFIFIAESIL